jgi:uncharacterized protein (UPF0335 family)
MSDVIDTYSVTADELRQFIERIEQLDAEKADLAEQAKEVMADDIAEEEAIMEMYKTALGMA